MPDGNQGAHSRGAASRIMINPRDLCKLLQLALPPCGLRRALGFSHERVKT